MKGSSRTRPTSKKCLFQLSGIDGTTLRQLVVELGQAIGDDMAQAMSLVDDLEKVVDHSEVQRFLDMIGKDLKGYDPDGAMENFTDLCKFMHSHNNIER